MKKLLPGLLLLIAFAGCKKTAVEPNTVEILTGARWQITKLTLESPLGASPADVTVTTFKACELDDIIEFKTGGVFSCKENKDTCYAGTNNSIFAKMDNGTWELSALDTVLTIKGGFLQQSFKFSKKVSNSIEIYQQTPNYLGQLVRYTYFLRGVQ